MATIRVNKAEAARRQINTAIRLLFDSGDPVSIHTLAAAGARIVRDLCEKRGDAKRLQQLKDHIVPGKEKQFWGAMNRAANFFKHADEDADETFEGIDERANDLLLFFAIAWYVDLGHSPTREMGALIAFIAANYPGLVKAAAPRAFKEVARMMDGWSRAGRLALFNAALNAP